MSFRTPSRNQMRGTIQSRNPAASINRGFQHLLSERNRSAPISSLPIEMMAKIFKFAQEDDDDDDEEFYAGSSELAEKKEWYWVKVTHVCRSWREIALGCQALWTTLNTGCHVNVMQTQAFLDRSGSSQIVVFHRSKIAPGGNRIMCLHLALGHLPRIRELFIYETTRSEGLSLQNLLSNAAPVLREFDFKLPTGYCPSTLFSGRTPQLESLWMRFTSGSWSNLPIVRGLKKLLLSNLDKKPTLTEILTILRENPNLMSLWLSATELASGLGPPTLRMERQAQRPIKLSSMKELTISNMDYTLLSRLLRSVIIPVDTYWNITCENYPLHDPSDIIPSALNRNMPCNSLHLSLDPVFIRIATDPGNAIVQRRKGLPVHSFLEFVWLDSDGLADIGTVFRLVESIIADRFWSSATEVNVDMYGGFDLSSAALHAMIWTTFLTMFPRILKIVVCKLDGIRHDNTTMMESHDGFLDALARPFRREDGKWAFICPQLSELCLYGLDFNFHLQKLVETLSLRANNGLRLRVLRIHNSFNVTESRKALIRQCGCVEKLVVIEDDDDDDDDDDDEDEFDPGQFIEDVEEEDRMVFD